MNNQTTPDDAPDPTLNPAQQERAVYLQLVQTLMSMLPEPLDLGAGPAEARIRRDRAAIAVAASMLPVTFEEIELAARTVAAGAHASNCLHEAVVQHRNLKLAGKARAQAASMGRESRGYRAMLLRVQAARLKREATDAARGSAALTEHCVNGLMTDALDNAPPERKPEEAAREPEALARKEDLERDADDYALHYPHRARLIRRLGGLPERCDFGPPEPELVQAIVTGDGPNLRAADAWQARAA